MNATRNIEGLVFAAAAISLAGWAAEWPLISFWAAALAALVASRHPGSRMRPAQPGTRGAGPPTGRTPRDGGVSSTFLAFSGGEWLSSPSSHETEEDEEEEEEAGARERGTRAYEEFAAGLEDEGSEEISFLPPYVSNDARSAGDEDGAEVVERPGGEALIAGDLQESDESNGKMPVPRRFALGTVAIIRRLLDPADVERILVEQRRYPRLRFGDVAVQLGVLTADEVQELLVAQEEGIFSEDEIADARRRLAEYHGSAG